MARRAGRDHKCIGAAAMDHGALLAVEHPAVSSPARPCGDMLQIIAGSPLDLGEGEFGLSLDQCREDTLLLRRRATACDELPPQADGGQVWLDHQALAD